MFAIPLRPRLDSQGVVPGFGAQQVHVIDAVRTSDHPRDQRYDLRPGVRAALRRDPDPLGDQRRNSQLARIISDE